jgi:uncharacterized protein YndB with AHSA1/START domain
MAEVAQIQAPLERTAPDTIRLERVLDAPVETVWRYLTEAELRREWFMGGTDARPDSEFELIVDHDNLSADDVPYPEAYAAMKGKAFNNKVLRFEPPKLLQTTFGDSGIVTYELFREGDRSRLVLTHSGIETPGGFENFGSGWTSHLAVLEARIQVRAIPNFWALHEQSKEWDKEALA